MAVAREQHEMRPVMIGYQTQRSRITDDGRRRVDCYARLAHGLGQKLNGGGAGKNDPLRGDRQIHPRKLCGERYGRVGRIVRDNDQPVARIGNELARSGQRSAAGDETAVKVAEKAAIVVEPHRLQRCSSSTDDDAWAALLSKENVGPSYRNER